MVTQHAFVGDGLHCTECGYSNQATISATVPIHEDGRKVSDTEAIELIAELLRDPEWGTGMLEDIADIIRDTGRSVENYPDNRPTWGRH